MMTAFVRGSTDSTKTHTHTMDVILCMMVGDCRRANLEAGGWLVIYIVSGAHIHTESHTYAYST